MKQLKDLTVKRFRCDYCKKITRTSKGMEDHEYRCYYNPKRSCDTCSNEGVEMLMTSGANLGVIFDGDERLCPSCLIAERVGGKSYITQETKDSFGIKVGVDRRKTTNESIQTDDFVIIGEKMETKEKVSKV